MNGTQNESMSFSAWGERRNGLHWNKYESTELRAMVSAIENSHNLTKGFTGHEHDDEVDLINMNGRLYDPVIGRFISADPFVQAPEMTQSYNRYTYVLNNPLGYVDPSGYIARYVAAGARAIGSVIRGVGAAIRSVFGGGSLRSSRVLSRPSISGARNIVSQISPGSQVSGASVDIIPQDIDDSPAKTIFPVGLANVVWQAKLAHTHPYVSGMEGVPVSGGDLHGVLGYKNGFVSFVEAGNRRFAFEVVDQVAASSHLKDLTRRNVKIDDVVNAAVAADRTSHSFQNMVLNHVKSYMKSNATGLKLYSTRDKDKLDFKEEIL